MSVYIRIVYNTHMHMHMHMCMCVLYANVLLVPPPTYTHGQAIDPRKITMLVLDEADVMIDQQGQQDQTVRIKK